jgi:hypothetical protein
MAEKPTFLELLDDLVRWLETRPYAVECMTVWSEGQITIRRKESTLLLRA